jgi:pyridinium-3,5-bisthiocarboxylic acid mononucleotide nickel chelatase
VTTEERLAYFDCASGATAEMLLGSLVSAGLLEADLRDLLAPLQQAGAAFDLRIREVEKGPVKALELRVTDQVPDVEARLGDMLTLLNAAKLRPGVLHDSTVILRRLAEEEARHAGERTDDVTFTGTSGIDSVVGTVGFVGALAALDVRTVFCSPVNVGAGSPVIAALLGNAPVYEESPSLTVVTPVAAAILGTLTSEWPASPPFAGSDVGYGAGMRDLPRPNVVRCFLGYGTIRSAPKPGGTTTGDA